MSDDFIIDDEVKALLTPLTNEQYDTLEQLIVEGLHVDKLVIGVVDGKRYLADGINRRNICIKHGIPYQVRDKKFNTRADMLQWVIDNQMGRRNLTPERIAYFRGKEYLNQKQSHGDAKRVSPSGHNDHLEKTEEKLAEKHNVAPKTIRRDAEFAEAVDHIAETQGEPAKQAVLNGHAGESKKAIASGKEPIFCDRCKRAMRVGQTLPKSCPDCKELRGEKKAEPKPEPKKKPGAVLFNDKQVIDLIGKLARLFDDRARVYGKGKNHDNCINALDQVLNRFNQWKAS